MAGNRSATKEKAKAKPEKPKKRHWANTGMKPSVRSRTYAGGLKNQRLPKPAPDDPDYKEVGNRLSSGEVYRTVREVFLDERAKIQELKKFGQARPEHYSSDWYDLSFEQYEKQLAKRLANRMQRWATFHSPSIRQRLFLKAVSISGNISFACAVTDTARPAFERWRKTDPEFCEQFNLAMEIAADRWEMEVVRRATEGVLEPVFYKGEVAGHIRKYSDTLLMFLLRGRRPHIYKRDKELNDLEQQIPDGLDLNQLTDEELDQFSLLMQKAALNKPNPTAQPALPAPAKPAKTIEVTANAVR